MKIRAYILIVLILTSLLSAIACNTGSIQETTAALPETSPQGNGMTTITTTPTTTIAHSLPFSSSAEFGELGAALESRETETFAGCWKEGGSFVIAFTRDGEETLKRYVQLGSPMANAINLITFPNTLKALKTIQMDTYKTLNSLNLFCFGGIDVKQNMVDVDVTDSLLFYDTLEQAGVALPPQVKVNIIYEPLREVPSPVTPIPGVHFPQLKMASGAYMIALMTGKLELKNSYLCVEDTIIIWQPDYFLTDNYGATEVLDKAGQVVARVGDEVVMGGGGWQVADIDRLLTEPLPPDCTGPFWIQGSGTRLSLNFNSDLFSLNIIPYNGHEFYFFNARPRLDEEINMTGSFKGQFIAGYGERLLRSPIFFTEEKPEENKGSLQFTLLWPFGYKARVENGVFEVVDIDGNVVLRDGDEVTLEGKINYGGVSGVAGQLHEELPGGISGPYMIVDKVVRE